MSRNYKRIAAIHDLSGLGRSSLAVVMPIISCMGIQVCPVPTAVLSTQTSGYEHYSFVDLTDTLPAYFAHWQSLGMDFDGIYSGFLGSKNQIQLVSGFIDTFADEGTLVVVDPVLGDDGQLYATMDEQMVAEMVKLVRKADVITPNFTELKYLLGATMEEQANREQIEQWMKTLSEWGPKVVMVTSVPIVDEPNQTSVLAYHRPTDQFYEVKCTYIPAHYPGTGDIFASVIVGSLLQGVDLLESLTRGADFVTKAINNSFHSGNPIREGVLLEPILKDLMLN